MALAEKSEQLQVQQLAASRELACGTHLLCLLLEISVSMEKEESTVLRSALTALTQPSNGQARPNSSLHAMHYLSLRACISCVTRSGRNIHTLWSFPAPNSSMNTPPPLPALFNTCLLLSFQGWEELTDAALTHLLRTTLAKSSKERAGMNYDFILFFTLGQF